MNLSDMQLKEFLDLGLICLLVGSGLLQLAPIKIDPWSALAKRLGRAINGEVLTKVEQLEKNMKEIQQSADERAAKDARARILRFGDELLHGTLHSKEHFDQILLDVTEYEEYCRMHPEFKNNMTRLTTENIAATYRHCMKEHSFL